MRWTQLALWVLVGLYSWQSGRHRASREQVDAVRTRVDVLSERIKHLPESGEFAEVSTDLRVVIERLSATREGLERVRQDLSGELTRVRQDLSGELTRVRTQMDRMDEFMRKEHG